MSRKTILLMAVVTGVIVANLNFIQPIENLIATDFGVSKAVVGILAMVTQLGYAFGLLLIVPLGDIFDRYHLIQFMMVLSIISLIVAFLAPNAAVFAVATTLIGITSVAPQIIIPYAGYLAPALQRGKVLGIVLSGLLTGILLSRSFSGLLGSIMPWQDIYLVAAVIDLIFLVIVHRFMPKDQRGHQDLNYLSVIKMLPKLFITQKELRGSSINGFCMFGMSNVLWSTIAFYLADQYHLGSNVAGLLGLLGIAGVLVAPWVGDLVDQKSPKLTIGLSMIFSGLAFVIFWLVGFWIIGLIVGIVLLDLGTQFSQVSNQAIVQSINRKQSSRNNSVFMFSYFLGGSIGTLSATWAWGQFGWSGVCVVAFVFLLISILDHLIVGEPQKLNTEE
ncbi:MFS transporter [Companilactobacillus pabuli]|jgi:predicted MFS family arabinose efflux permease|uniref:MFS transporter n=1 Tax=Companilactobacillus pabuli TaxID=2714036 RepID=UPI00065B28A6|nr:MFS transporter [Companilactobacillus pabuli]AKP04206.1 MFS transporter permease [Companilactobacillus farciminis]AKS52512.1 MFS transporter permease [Companilactobacillus farciminis]MDG5113552.1 MFS transporter [Companilactobacillus pabuli]